MKRIVIVGISGCGKTTLATTLSKIINVPCIDLDDYYWLPGWQVREAEEFQHIIDQLTSKKSWIVNGNYSRVADLIWDRCDTVIWLDYNLFRCFCQGICRSIKRIIFKKPCCNGNYENFKMTFLS